MNMDAGKGKGIDKPNYTQTPNILFDELLREMGEAELKVTLAVVRNTFGWRRDFYEMSLTDLQEITGLSRPTVIKGIDDGIKRGLLRRKVDDGGTYYYGLIVGDDSDDDESKQYVLVKKVNRRTSKKSLPVVVKNLNQGGKNSLPEVVKNIDQHTPTIKKDKKKKERKGKERNSAEQNLTVQSALIPSFVHSDSQPEIGTSVALLTDPEVGLDEPKARELAAKYSFDQIERHVFAWRDETSEFTTLGALITRFDLKFNSRALTTAQKESDLYRRHHPEYQPHTGSPYTQPPTELRRNYCPPGYEDIVLGYSHDAGDGDGEGSAP